MQPALLRRANESELRLFWPLICHILAVIHPFRFKIPEYVVYGLPNPRGQFLASCMQLQCPASSVW